MNFINQLNLPIQSVFQKLGYDENLAVVTLSNRPDLAEYQCNAAMALAKTLHKAPIVLAQQIAEALREVENSPFSRVETVMPGFINLTVSADFYLDFLISMAGDEKLGAERAKKQRIIVDYGGANVAKPLHVGHLRTAVIGESVKRILLFMGHEVIGDIHMGDWGLQMGLIIEELKERKPELPYFDEKFSGEYPEDSPFTISELEEIYPTASKKSKEDEGFLKRAQENTYLLQHGNPAYLAIWKHIMKISIADLKKNYDAMDVHFDLWKGESDADPFIPELLERLTKENLLVDSDGAKVVPVQEESDKIEIPPCIILKSDGASLYATTDLATIIDREKNYHPDRIIYITDKRQALHFEQVFRVAKKAKLLPEKTVLTHIGYGTMNGKDGKPFKTRSGGVMRLEMLLKDTENAVQEKMKERYENPEENLSETAKMIALAAIKYGDLSNQASKDYCFDLERFSSFDGNTGPYLLYSMVRIQSIFRKSGNTNVSNIAIKNLDGENPAIRAVLKNLVQFPETMKTVSEDLAPHKLCAYLYNLADSFSTLYHDVPILKEDDPKKKESYAALLKLILEVFRVGISLLGFSAPEKM